jgi:hypothetical protein
MTHQQIKNCVDACIACATTCTNCAISCLEEENVKNLTSCIRLDLECGAICKAAAELMSIEGAYSKELCQLCAAICNACAEECEKHAAMGMDHCKECAEACRACAKETMAIYQVLEAQEQEAKEKQHFLVTQEECAIVSRLTAELISLKSSYAKQTSEINVNACHAVAEDLDGNETSEKEHCNACSTAAKEAHVHLAGSTEKEQPKAAQDELNKNNKKHSSALLAASVWRSPSRAARSHVDRDVRGRRSPFTNAGPFISL